MIDELPKPEVEEKDSGRAPAPGNGFRVKIAVFMVLLIAAAVGTWAYLHYRDRVSSDDANVDGHIAAIASKISGSVLEVAVLDNQPVKAGQVLVLSLIHI